jgi:hypothetical protein
MTGKNEVGDIRRTVSHMKKTGVLKILIFALLAGMLLLAIGSFFSEREEGDLSEVDEQERGKLAGFFEYKDYLEKEIEGLCSSVSGVGGAKAVVFFGEAGEILYAQNVQYSSQSSEKSEYVIIGSGSGAHALYIGESLPTLSGIGVICDTGDSEGKRNELLRLLSSAYGLPMTRIHVSERG